MLRGSSARWGLCRRRTAEVLLHALMDGERQDLYLSGKSKVQDSVYNMPPFI